jgi:hypothetical protein
MASIEYKFEELHPFRGMYVLVNGTAEVEAEWISADPDSGIAHSGWGYYINAIYIDSLEKGDERFEITKDHPLFDPICNELVSTLYVDSINEQLDETFDD